MRPRLIIGSLLALALSLGGASAGWAATWETFDESDRSVAVDGDAVGFSFVLVAAVAV